jgi:histidinol dehydrogenase
MLPATLRGPGRPDKLLPTPITMIPLLDLSSPAHKKQATLLLSRLRLDAKSLVDPASDIARISSTVTQIIQDVHVRGDDALVDIARKFDDANFSKKDLIVDRKQLVAARKKTDAKLMKSIVRAIDQVREYQEHIMPRDPKPLKRGKIELGLRFSSIDRAGLYVPGGKASYPSSLIMLAVPAQVAGVKTLIATTPPSKYGKSELLLATACELGFERIYRVGGAGAIAAMALGTQSIPQVDKIVGPGNLYVQAAKRLVSGAVGIDSFAGPSEILVIADKHADAGSIAADLLAQAEHDPGSCFLLTDSNELAKRVIAEIDEQLATLSRRQAIERALQHGSAILVDKSMPTLIELANKFAAEHVSVQVKDQAKVLRELRHAGAIFIGPYSPVAAGDYLAGPSHCLPTNTTARFTGGISVYEFLKRTGTIRYDAKGLARDADAIERIALAEGLDAHAKSVKAGVRTPDDV